MVTWIGFMDTTELNRICIACENSCLLMVWDRKTQTTNALLDELLCEGINT
jgi:hypothetical protein